MEDWQYQEDEMLANPPEGKDSHFLCAMCKEPFYEGDRYYELDGECFCPGCATIWLEDQYHFASYEQCHGEEE